MNMNYQIKDLMILIIKYKTLAKIGKCFTAVLVPVNAGGIKFGLY